MTYYVCEMALFKLVLLVLLLINIHILHLKLFVPVNLKLFTDKRLTK